jgi:hypothetical protein
VWKNSATSQLLLKAYEQSQIHEPLDIKHCIGIF